MLGKVFENKSCSKVVCWAFVGHSFVKYFARRRFPLASRNTMPLMEYSRDIWAKPGLTTSAFEFIANVLPLLACVQIPGSPNQTMPPKGQGKSAQKASKSQYKSPLYQRQLSFGVDDFAEEDFAGAQTSTTPPPSQDHKRPTSEPVEDSVELDDSEQKAKRPRMTLLRSKSLIDLEQEQPDKVTNYLYQDVRPRNQKIERPPRNSHRDGRVTDPAQILGFNRKKSGQRSTR